MTHHHRDHTGGLADLLSLTPDGRCDLADGSGRYYPGVPDAATCEASRLSGDRLAEVRNQKLAGRP